MAQKNHVPDVVEIPLTRGKSVIIDAEDAERVLQYKWFALQRSATFHACTHSCGEVVLMHRLLLNAQPSLQVVHHNGDGLDNRKCNLATATRSQKNANHGYQENNTSGYKGVTWHRKDKKWRSRIGYKGQRIELGEFATKEEAAKAYDTAADQLFGQVAKTNAALHRPSMPAKPKKSPIVTPEVAVYSARRHLQKNNTSGYRGVRYQRARWTASISINGKTKHLGSFDSAQDAARAYECATQRRKYERA